MNIANLKELLDSFAKFFDGLTGEHISINKSEKVDIAKFPYEIDENHNKLNGFQSGLYAFQAKDSEEMLYIGEAKDIIQRIYRHIGPGFTWAINGAACYFPNFGLTQWEGHKDYKETFESGNVYVTAFSVDPPEARNMLESFIIYAGFVKYGKLRLNIKF